MSAAYHRIACWLCAATALLLTACAVPTPAASTASSAADGEPLRVVATTNIVADVVSQVGGDAIEMTDLLPVGADPHSYTIAPQDMRTLNEAHVVFVNGLGLEEGMESTLENLDGSAAVVSVNENVETMEFGEEGHAHEDEHEDEHGDEHGDEHEHDEEGPTPHACKHLGDEEDEEAQAIQAVPSADAVETIAEDVHVRLDVSLSGEGDSFFTYHAEESTEYAFFSDTPLSMMLVTESGESEPQETQADFESDCALVVAYLFDLEEGEHTFALRDTDATFVRLVVEETEHEEGEEHGEEHGEGEHAGEEHEEGEHEEGEHAGEEHEEGEHEEGEEHNHDHEGADPHTWTSVHSVESWVETIVDTLSTLDPTNAETYANNGAAYVDELAALESEIDELVAVLPEDQRKLVTDHDSFSYFANEYGFEIVGTVSPGATTTAEPSAQEIAALIEQIEEEATPAIFVGTTVNADLAAQIASDTGAQVVPLYTGSLSEADGPAATYIDFMRYNANAIVNALGP